MKASKLKVFFALSFPGFDPWVGKILWRRKWQPLQHSCLENPMDGEVWWATVHGVAKSQTRLNDFTFTFFAIYPKIKSKKSCRLGENTNPTFNTGFICIMCKECVISVLIKQIMQLESKQNI